MLCGSQLYTCGSTKQKEQSRHVFELALLSLITHPHDHLHSIVNPATVPLISLLSICPASAGVPFLQGNGLILDGSSEHLRPLVSVYISWQP